MAKNMAKPDHTETPKKKTTVSIDWEEIFHNPDTGLIPLIGEAKSAQSLQKCSQVIIKTLFNRDGDEDRRTAFSAVIKDVLVYTAKHSQSKAVALEAAKSKISQVLQSIKEDRQKRAKEALLANARKQSDKFIRTKELEIVETPPKQTEEVSSDNASWSLNTETLEEPEKPLSEDTKPQEVPEEIERTPIYEAGTPEAFFVRAMASAILDRLKALRGKSIKCRDFPEGIPFILSKDFAEHFKDILSFDILPRLVDDCYVLINRLTVIPNDKWEDQLKSTLEDKTERLILWERWQAIWLDVTTQGDIPPKPSNASVKPKNKILEFFAKLGEDDHYDDDDDEEMTMEEWKQAKAIINQSNEEADKIWQSLCEHSKLYIAPLDEDNRLLMELFGHDIEHYKDDMKKIIRINGSRQEQSRLFESYQQGDNLDLPLLSLCYGNPDKMLKGKDSPLISMLSGFDVSWKKQTLPLTTRFLSRKISNTTEK